MVPELSVIILSYNNFAETTRPCLESLARVRALRLELIVVDNGSDEPTRCGLAEAARRDERMRRALKMRTWVFGGGNNDGVAVAGSELVVLLNSDTRVLKNSLSLLAAKLYTTSAPLVLGPVTNAAGTEQQIYCNNGTVADLLAQGTLWSNKSHGSFFSTDQLTFFCVAMARTTYLELGGLDESFGVGFYEDADFCCRAAGQGISLQVMEEAFVYHQGSASFSKHPERVRRLLKENRNRFEKKHGNSRTMHVRKKNLQVLTGYLLEADGGDGFSSSTSYRFTNRLRRAHELTPNNYLKKIMYWRQLRQLKQSAFQIGNWQENELFT